MARKTFSEAVNEFVQNAPWLGTDDEPAVTALVALAAALDREMSAALVAQYGLTYRNLLSRKPAEDNGPTDPLAAALEAANG